MSEEIRSIQNQLLEIRRSVDKSETAIKAAVDQELLDFLSVQQAISDLQQKTASLEKALRTIAQMETPRANATVRRMAAIANQATRWQQ
jgi:predicted  nucleic acid-binding Zn-ribbon protein